MTNRKIRDTVFCHFMSNESHLLSLCNALNDTGYDESSDITINTLEGSFFSNIKNDISFLLNNLMVVLIEHQTTINPSQSFSVAQVSCLSQVLTSSSRQATGAREPSVRRSIIPTV